MEQNLTNDEIEIDLKELFFLLLHKAWIIILCFIVGAGVMGAGTKVLIDPIYESTATLYVLTKTTSVTSLADIQLGTQLTKDYEILIVSRPVVEQVIENLDLEQEYEELLEQITVNVPVDTRIIEIIATDKSPKQAKKIADEMAEVSAKRMAEVMATDPPSIAETGHVAEDPVAPSPAKNGLLGGLVLALLAAAIIVVMHLMNDTIRTEDDVERYLGLNILSSIPVPEAEKEAAKDAKKEPKKKGGEGHAKN